MLLLLLRRSITTSSSTTFFKIWLCCLTMLVVCCLDTSVHAFSIVPSRATRVHSTVAATAVTTATTTTTTATTTTTTATALFMSTPIDPEDDWEDGDDEVETVEVLDQFANVAATGAEDDDEEEDESTEVTSESTDSSPKDVAAVEEDDVDEEVEFEELDVDFVDLDEERAEPLTSGGIGTQGMHMVDSSHLWKNNDDDAYYELEDDLDDPNYTAQKKLTEEAVSQAQNRARRDPMLARAFDGNEQSDEASFESMELPDVEEMEDIVAEMEAARVRGGLPNLDELEETLKDLEITADDMNNIDLNDEDAMEITHDPDDPFPYQGDDFLGTGISGEEAGNLEKALLGGYEKENEEIMMRDKIHMAEIKGVDGLPQETIDEMWNCLYEIDGSPYNATNWLIYDLDFNVTNLLLAAVQVSPDAPILFQHWYPQLLTYQRYEYCRDIDFDFTWDHVAQANVTELETYYAGFGYDEIPEKAPSETGIIGLEDLDEDEIKMAAFERWVLDVYNPEDDRLDLDDDNLRDEDNAFSKFYEAMPHPDVPNFDDAKEEIEDWNEQMGPAEDEEEQEYRNEMGEIKKYQYVRDEEFERDFRGHLIVACTSSDADLDVAEKITLRFEQEFGKQVFVETRIMSLALEEDNVLEIWLESYEIELLHSKRRAAAATEGWDGPEEVDDQQLNYLTKRVGFLISDDSRYSYSYEVDVPVD